jgi:hypothetical protein
LSADHYGRVWICNIIRFAVSPVSTRIQAWKRAGFSVDEMQSSARQTREHFVFVICNIFIIVQPMLDLRAGLRTSKEYCRYLILAVTRKRHNYLRSLAAWD